MPKRPSLTARIDVADGKVYLNGVPSPDGSDGSIELALKSLRKRVVRERIHALHVAIAHGPGKPHTHMVISSEGLLVSVENAEEAQAYIEGRTILIGNPSHSVRRRPRGMSRREMWISIVGSALITGGISWGVASTQKNSHIKSKVTPKKLNRAPSPGWNEVPVWDVEIARGTVPVPSDDGRLAVVTPDYRVRLLDPHTGKPVWTSSDRIPNESSVALSMIDGTLNVCIRHSSGLTVMNTETRDPGIFIPLERGMNIKYTGSSPLVTHSRDSKAWIIRESELASVRLPNGSFALCSDNGIVSASTATGRRWCIFPDRTSHEIPLRPPEKGSRLIKVMGSGYGTFAASWSGQDEGKIWVTLDQTTIDKRIFSREVYQGKSPLRWFRAVGGRTVVLGPVIMGMKSGNILVSPGFSPVSGYDDVVYGRREGGNVIAAYSTGQTAEIPEGTAIPWSVLRSGYAVVVDVSKEGVPRVCTLRHSNS